MKEPQDDAHAEDVGGKTLECITVIFVLNLRSHIHFCALSLTALNIDWLDHAKIAELEHAVVAHKDVL